MHGIVLLGRLVATLCSLAALAAWDGGGALQPPPATLDAAAWSAWLDRREPVDAAVAIVRLAVLGAGGYVTALAAATAAAARTASPRLRGAVDAVSLPLARAVARRAVGAALVSAALAPAPAAAAEHDRPPVLRQLPDPPRSLTGRAAAPPASRPATSAPPTLVTTVPPAPTAAAAPSTTSPSTRTTRPPLAQPVAGASPTPASADGAEGPAEWEVRPGDHFWSIARRVLERATGHRSTNHEVDRYWRRLVSANLDRLVVPGNPDLLRPGQVLRIPPP